MESLNAKDITESLIAKIKAETPFLGICVDCKCCLKKRRRSSGVKGLGIFPGKLYGLPKAKYPDRLE